MVYYYVLVSYANSPFMQNRTFKISRAAHAVSLLLINRMRPNLLLEENIRLINRYSNQYMQNDISEIPR